MRPVINVSFGILSVCLMYTQPANYCMQYPVLNYTLEVEAPSSEILSVSTADVLSITIDNLTEDLYYSFKVVVANSVGTVSTNDTGFCELFKLFVLSL